MNYSIISRICLMALVAISAWSCGQVGKENQLDGYKFILRQEGKEAVSDTSIIHASLAIYATKTDGSDTLVRNSYNEPAPIFIDLRDSSLRQMPLVKILMQHGKIGDSLTIFIPADTAFKTYPRPEFIKEGTPIRQEVRLLKAMNGTQLEEEINAMRQKQMEKMMEAQAEQQRKMDSVKVAQVEYIENTYFAEKGITNFKKTESGLFYTVEKQGKNTIQPGQNVKVNYEGTLLMTGNKFDSSFDRGEPIEFPIGQGQVIKGWDEGIPLIGKGGKGYLYIPAHLGYGAQGAGQDIKPFSMLVFRVEVLD